MKTLTVTNPLTTIVLGIITMIVGIVLATALGNWFVAAIAAYIGFGTYSGAFTGLKTGALIWAIAVASWIIWVLYMAGHASLLPMLAISTVVTVIGGLLIGVGDKSRDKAKTAIAK